MSVTVVNDYRFKPDGDKNEGMAAAAELVDHFVAEHPGVQLSLWLEDVDDPLRHFHITIFDSEADVEKAKASKGIERFVERLYPHIDRDTHVAPAGRVWLAGGAGVKSVPYRP